MEDRGRSCHPVGRCWLDIFQVINLIYYIQNSAPSKYSTHSVFLIPPSSESVGSSGSPPPWHIKPLQPPLMPEKPDSTVRQQFYRQPPFQLLGDSHRDRDVCLLCMFHGPRFSLCMLTGYWISIWDRPEVPVNWISWSSVMVLSPSGT